MNSIKKYIERKNKEINQYTIIFNNIKHIIKFEIENKRILFTVIKLPKNKEPEYYLHQSKLESLCENSKILQLYPSENELKELFDSLFKNQKIYLEYNNTASEINDNENYNDIPEKELFLIIKLNIIMKEEILLLPLEKKSEISIDEKYEIEYEYEDINGKDKEIEELNYNYIKLKEKYEKMVKEHDREINQFNIEIKELKEQNNDLKQRINILLEQINQLNDLINKSDNNNLKNSLSNVQNLIDRIEILEELKEESTKSSKKTTDGVSSTQLSNSQMKKTINIKKLKKCFKSSTILTNETEYDFLLNKLSIYNPTSYKIIYKTSIDGDSIKNFHSNCDGEENILIIIETNKGYKFGGFTSIGFDSSGYELRDDKAFLFSIDRQKIYDIIEGNNAIYCNRKFGPIFCSKPDSTAYSIFIPDNYLKNKSSTTKNCYCYKMEQNFEINNGKKEFLIKEMEVFRLDND